MDYRHQSVAENHWAFGPSQEAYSQQNNWFVVHPLPGEMSDTAARVADMFYIGERRSSRSPNSYVGGCKVSGSATLHPWYYDEPSYHLEVSRIPNQSPIPFQGNLQMPMERHLQSPDVDSAITELVPCEMRSTEQGPLEFDLIRQAAASEIQITPQSLNSASNSPEKGSTLKKKKHKKEGKSKKKKTARRLDQFKDDEYFYGDEVPPTLKSTCPDEERFIFECQWRHRHKSDQDMWNNIQDDFFKRFNQKHSGEVLRMKFSRAKSKYIQWFPEDEDTLLRAWEQVERDRYQMILETFHQLGGSRNMRLNPSDIEVKLAKDFAFDQKIYAGRSIGTFLSSAPTKNSLQ